MQIYFSSKMQWGSLFEELGWGIPMMYKIKLRYRVFCSGRLMIEGELFIRSKSFLLFRGRGPLKKGKNNAEM
jgi:hypothetical protein